VDNVGLTVMVRTESVNVEMDPEAVGAAIEDDSATLKPWDDWFEVDDSNPSELGDEETAVGFAWTADSPDSP